MNAGASVASLAAWGQIVETACSEVVVVQAFGALKAVVLGWSAVELGRWHECRHCHNMAALDDIIDERHLVFDWPACESCRAARGRLISMAVCKNMRS